MHSQKQFYQALLIVGVISIGLWPSRARAQQGGYSPPELGGLFWGEAVPSSPGRHFLRTQITNDVRWTIVYVPTNRSVTPAPLVLALHGGGHSAGKMESDHPNLIAAASEMGVVLAFPNGHEDIGGAQTWVAFGPVHIDRGYLEGVILWLQHYLPIDTKRTFMTGFSAGAGMTQRFAADRPNRIKAGAAFCYSSGLVVATNGGRAELPTPEAPISMFLVRGGLDEAVPPDGITVTDKGFICDSVADHMEFWVTAAGGTTNDLMRTDVDATTTRFTYSGGTALVEMTYDRSLGHRWETERDRPVLNWLLSLPTDATLRREGTNVVVTFASGILQSADRVTGAWSDVSGATSPHLTPLAGSARFFRTRR